MPHTLFLVLLSGLFAQAGELPTETKQLIVVTSDQWSSKTGNLQRYEKRDGRWMPIGKAFGVALGKNGMGWGRGIRDFTRRVGPVKREGDSRTPAGVFALPFAFGEGKETFRYPYRRMADIHRCVDDSRSQYYNRIIDSRTTDQDYNTYERMKFASGLYRYGIFVAHNPRSIPRAGSCIFMHIRKADGSSTTGCTAMDQEDIVLLIRWLDPDKKPLLVQMPQEILKKLYPIATS